MAILQGSDGTVILCKREEVSRALSRVREASWVASVRALKLLSGKTVGELLLEPSRASRTRMPLPPPVTPGI